KTREEGLRMDLSMPSGLNARRLAVAFFTFIALLLLGHGMPCSYDLSLPTSVPAYSATNRRTVLRSSCRRLSGSSTSASAHHCNTHQPTSRGSLTSTSNSREPSGSSLSCCE